MEKFTVGDTVTITGPVMTGNVGTVVSLDVRRERYLVRIDGATQNYFSEDQLETFSAS